MAAARRRAHKPAVKPDAPAEKPEAAESEQPKPPVEPKAEPKAEPKGPAKSGSVYVNVETLSWRPHPLPRGLEVSDILPKDVLEQGLSDGRLTRQAPEAD